MDEAKKFDADGGTNSNEDRRRYQRFSVEATGEVFVKDSQQQPVVVKNICVRGADVVMNYPLEINASITIDIQMPLMHDAIQRKARVAWCRKIDERLWEVGLDFGETNLIDME